MKDLPPKTLPPLLCLVVLMFVVGAPLAVAQPSPAVRLNKLLAEYELPGVTASAIGVTRRGTPIPCLTVAEDYDLATERLRVLLVGGLDGQTESIAAVLSMMRDAQQQFPQAVPSTATLKLDGNAVAFSAVPCANPDGWAHGRGDKNLSGGRPATPFPPPAKAYNSATDPEAQYLWRWVGMHAPDLVVIVQRGGAYRWSTGALAAPLREALQSAAGPVEQVNQPSDLVAALSLHAPSETGSIPALRVSLGDRDWRTALRDLLRALTDSGYRSPSPARQALRRRVARQPLQVAEQLAEHYGHDLKQVVYIPALALVGRARLTALTGETAHLRDVRRIVADYESGDRASLGSRVSGSHLSGHLVFSHLARATGERRFVELARRAADLGFGDDGSLLESMPYHNEMSDSVFMGCAILAEVGQLTGEDKYYEMCLRHLRFMQRHCLRSDGIYRHSPLDAAAWGRGNGFPALGLALVLTAVPADHWVRPQVLQAHRDHLRALAKLQDVSGAWHQVVDHPESYRELTSTCMITFAMIRGIRKGWLSAEEFGPSIDRAWQAIKTRVPANGRLVDVCTGTGKQQNLRAYYDRTAILGPDARGGAMALMVATEMAAWEREQER